MAGQAVRFTPEELQYIAQNKQPEEILQMMPQLDPQDRKTLGKIMGEGLLSSDMPSGKFLRGSAGMGAASVAIPAAASLGGPAAVSAASNPYVQGGVGMAAVNALPLPSSIKYAIEAALGLRTMMKGGQASPSKSEGMPGVDKSSQTLPMSDAAYQSYTGHPRLGSGLPGKAPNSPAGPSFPSGMGEGMPKVPPFGQGMAGNPGLQRSPLDSLDLSDLVNSSLFGGISAYDRPTGGEATPPSERGPISKATVSRKKPR